MLIKSFNFFTNYIIKIVIGSNTKLIGYYFLIETVLVILCKNIYEIFSLF